MALIGNFLVVQLVHLHQHTCATRMHKSANMVSANMVSAALINKCYKMILCVCVLKP